MVEAMMRPVFISLAALVIAAGLWTAGAPLAAAQTDPDWSSELQSCVAERRSLLAVFLVDESGSLRDGRGGPGTDPEDQRVSGVQLGISSLANLVDRIEVSIDAPVRLDVSIIGFASIATERQRWGSAEQALSSTALTEMADRDGGQETDYANALISTLDSFQTQSAAVAAQTGVDPCKIMYWFTDGKFDIVSRRVVYLPDEMDEQKVWAPDIDLRASAEGIIERGRQVICDTTSFANSGIADQLRLAGVITISLALTEQIDPADEQFLESIAINPQGNRCGREASIGMSSQLADNSALPCEFGTPLDGTKAFPGECNRQVLDPSVSQVVQGDPGMDRAHFVVSSSADEIRLSLTPPSGAAFALFAGDTTTSSGARIDTEFIAPNVATVEIDFDPSSIAWIGDWVIEVEDPTGSNGAEAFRQLTYWGDYQPSMRLSSEMLFLGDDGDLAVDVVTSAGTPVDVSTFAAFDVSIVAPEVNGVQFSEAARADDSFIVVVGTNGAAIGLVETEVTIRAQTESGIQLQPVTVPGSFRISGPPGYPTLVTESLRPDPIQDAGETAFELEVSGAAANNGCVWLEALVPGDASSRLGSTFTIESDAPMSEADCRQVPAGESVVFSGVVRSSDPARGRFNGTIAVKLQARSDKPVVTAQADIAFSVDVTPDGQRRTQILAGMLLLGVLVPLLITYLLGWAGARFRSGGRLKHLVIPVRIGPDGLRSQHSNDAPTVDRTAFEPGPNEADGARRFALGGTRFRTRVSLNPFSAPTGLAETSAGVLLLSSGRNDGRARSLSVNQAPVNLDLPEQWQLSVPLSVDRGSLLENFEDNELSGELIVLVPFDDESRAEELVAAANSEASQRIRPALDAIKTSDVPAPNHAGKSDGTADAPDGPDTGLADSQTVDKPPASKPQANPWI